MTASESRFVDSLIRSVLYLRRRIIISASLIAMRVKQLENVESPRKRFS